MSLKFEVNPSVLIPRPDTEILAQAAIDVLAGKHSNPRLLDLCTGSGCVGISVLKNCPMARGVLSDISEEAVLTARRNIYLNGLSSRCAAVCADVENGPKEGWGSFDVICANPPYIKSQDIQDLDRSVRDYEPVIALDGGADGLKFYGVIAKLFKPGIKPFGSLIFEIGIGQKDPVVSILKENGYARVEIIKDYSGIDRVLRAWL
jgi:release factor glutamine methyltransferase